MLPVSSWTLVEVEEKEAHNSNQLERRSQSPIAPTRATRGGPTRPEAERSETKQKRPSEIPDAMLQRAGASSGPSSELRRLVEEEDGARSDVAALLHDGENALEASTAEGVTRGSAGREPGLSAGEMDEESLLGTERRNNRAQDSDKWLGPCSGNVSATAVGFWLLGLMNNATFVIMNAGAKEIFAEGVGGVYLANVLPSLFVKASAPFWFHLVPYHVRITLCAALTVACLSTVALGQSLGVQLFGVAVGAFAGSLGEASFLAYSAFFDGPTALTAWSSGTGFAGVFGYFWVVFLTKALGFTFRASLLLAMVLPVAFLFVFFRILAPARAARRPTHAAAGRTREAHHDWSAWERVQIFASLWEFTVPLFLVYFAEYAMQSGTWAAIGFPIDSKAARDDFYVFANWLYQVGVFVSRSSGTLLRLSKRDLWLMPVLQMVLLVFFTANGVWHFWWNQSLLALAFVVGLLGGAVYVHGYILISREVAPERKEFALASASLADTLGIMLANMTGIIIQGCLYAVNDLTDEGRPPAFTCGKKYD